ncbi:ATP-binding protein [Kitasatospora sp. NPDC052896]|uniref:ATP-binding protein n=1 Tax=Kitasatospora sp. NPDC052896 TaxID=3364061 RepID=UPI0037CA7AAA
MIGRSPSPTGAHDCWLPYSRRAPGLARRALRGWLGSAPGGERFLRPGELLVSELVTNAVLHGRARGRLLRARFELEGERLRIEVHDAREERWPQRGGGAWEAEGGRGLVLVEALVVGWGAGARTSGVGKVVWCECAPEVGG